MKIKNKPPNKINKVDVSPIEPGINPKNISMTPQPKPTSLFCAKLPKIVSPEIASGVAPALAL